MTWSGEVQGLMGIPLFLHFWHFQHFPVMRHFQFYQYRTPLLNVQLPKHEISLREGPGQPGEMPLSWSVALGFLGSAKLSVAGRRRNIFYQTVRWRELFHIAEEMCNTGHEHRATTTVKLGGGAKYKRARGGNVVLHEARGGSDVLHEASGGSTVLREARGGSDILHKARGGAASST